MVVFCGNVGDAQTNPNLPAMVEYLYSSNNSVHMNINTNGGMRSTDYWANFAKYKNLKIWFAVDGTTQEVHSYYRQNTNLSKVLENAKAYIDAGGNAVLQFILFEHNQHQLKDVEKLVKDYKFTELEIINTDRADNTPVYNSKGEYRGQLRGATTSEYNNFLTAETENIKNNLQDPDITIDQIDIKNYTNFLNITHEKYINQDRSWEEEVEKFDWARSSLANVANISNYKDVDINKVLRGISNEKKNNRKIDCLAIRESKVFITADGFVYPCCMMGHNHTRIANAYTYDIQALLKEFGYKNDVNNALKYGGIEGVFKTGFFDTIANTWIPHTTENDFLRTFNKEYSDCGNLNMCAMACSNCDYNA
jgi:MoaA/NifB/PqqE/SkfB family radical SAM enzyme